MKGGTERGIFGRTLLLGTSGAAIVAMLAGPALAQSADDAVAADADPAASSEENAIVVTGRRAALQAATERKRNSETIIESVVADDAGKLPDSSITEVLQRVAGVSIVRFRALGDPDHFSVEGSGVQVRGLSGVASRLNGRDIFSANNGRGLLWGDVTPELMAAVDVYKASTADLIFGIEELVVHLSMLMTLEPGDIVSTGTPAGVGSVREPRVWLKPGDVTVISSPTLGVLETRLV